MSYTRFLIATFILVILSFTSNAQVLDPNDMLLDYYKILELKNPNIQERLNIHPSIVNGYKKDSLTWNPWEAYLTVQEEGDKAFTLLPFRTKASFNSTYVRSYNDGAVWQGRGLTMQTQTGFMGRFGKIRYAFAPVVFWSQNQDFDLASNTQENVDPYNYQFNYRPIVVRSFIDYVQRFGDESFFNFNLGQSEIRGVFNWFTFGLSTQNVVFGPAQRNPILLGNSGSMVPHLDLGTDRPVWTPLGFFEGKLYWGKMRESDFGNPLSLNSDQFFTAGAVAWNPKWLPGLTLGINRVFYKRWEDIGLTDLIQTIVSFNPPEDRLFGNDEFDQTASFTIKWSYPEAGFETYLEFAKSDFGGNVFRFEPEHGRAFTVGFIKLVELDEVDIKLNYEHTTLGQPKNSIIRSYNRIYSHSVARNGYTHRGQLLGAGIGPGSNGDWFDAKFYFRKSMVGATMQRIRFDDDYFFENFTQKENHDFEWSWGVQYEKLMEAGRLGMELIFSDRRSVYFIEDNNKKNIYLAVSFVKPL